MKNRPMDAIDKQLIALLARDGRLTVKELARQLVVSVPTIHSRMKALIRRGILKVAGLVDTFQTKDILTAIIAIQVDDVSKMPSILDELMNFKQVHWAVAVTGRYDIFAEVIITEGIEWLFTFYSEQMSKLEGISHSESFLITNTRRKWTLLPPDIEGWVQTS
jgi:Lrp/AsnC family transcriptional regulator, regulator for asnA, asnC and gidA